MTAVKEQTQVKAEGIQLTGVKQDPSKEALQDQVALALLSKASGNLKQAAQGANQPVKDPDDPSNIPESVLDSNPILRALCEKLQLDQNITETKQDLTQILLSYFQGQVSKIGELKDKINAIAQKLKENLNPDQIKALQAQMQTLETAYNTALSQIQSAQADQASKEDDNKSLTQKNEELEKELANETDPKKKQALENQIAANKSKISQNQTAIDQDKSTISGLQTMVNNTLAQFQALSSKYPSLSKSFDAIISEIKSGKNISDSCASLNGELSQEEKEDAQYVQQIQALSNQFIQEVQSISGHMNNFKMLMAHCDNAEAEAKAKINLQCLDGIVQNFVQLRIKDFFKVKDEKIAKKDDKELQLQLLKQKRGATIV